MEKILIPTDFSSNSENAILYALHMAQSLKAKPVFFYVTHKDILTSKKHDLFLIEVEKDKKNALEELKKTIANIYNKLHLHFDVEKIEFLVQYGSDPVSLITDLANSGKFSMIVMGTHGATGLDKIFMGSNTAGVIKNSKIPVLAIPSNYKYRRTLNVAYASDYVNIEKETSIILPYLKIFNSTLKIFTIYPTYPDKININKNQIKETVDRLIEKFKYEKIEFSIVKRENDNDIEGGIKEFISKNSPEMIIMFTQERSWLEHLIESSNTEEMVQEIQIPLLALKK